MIALFEFRRGMQPRGQIHQNRPLKEAMPSQAELIR